MVDLRDNHCHRRYKHRVCKGSMNIDFELKFLKTIIHKYEEKNWTSCNGKCLRKNIDRKN